jgi:phosphatidylglycerophosphate synthase
MTQFTNKYSLKYICAWLSMGKPNGEKGSRYEYKKEDFIISAHRKISEPFVGIISPISFITPNRVTWFGFGLGLLSVLTLALAGTNIIYLMIAAILFWLSAIFDCVDGQLARKRVVTTYRGEFLDSILELLKGATLWIAIAFNISTRKSMIFGFDVWFLATIVISFVSILTFMSIYASLLFKEPQSVSHGHVYGVMIMMVFNLFEIVLFVFSILSVVAVVYTLFEKTFLRQNENGEQLKVEINPK